MTTEDDTKLSPPRIDGVKDFVVSVGDVRYYFHRTEEGYKRVQVSIGAERRTMDFGEWCQGMGWLGEQIARFTRG